MAKYSFAKFNKERLFDIDTTEFDYVDLEDLYNENGEGAVYQVRGLYIGTKSNYDPETPILATDSTYVNLPVHQLAEVKAMIADKHAVEGVNSGACGFKIEKYYQKRFKKDCYAAIWGNYDELLAEAAE